MAKTVSPIFKFQGTIDDLTFVNSKRYKPHVRARKNSKTPFVMTAALAESKARLQQCNQYAKPVFQALKAELPDGALWSRLVSKLFAELKAGRPLGLECLKGFECNLQHPLSEVLPKGYDLSATRSQNQLGVYVQLHGHPAADDKMPRTGYQLRFVVITPDAENGTVTKVEGLGPLTKYTDELTAHDIPIGLPGTGPYLLLMGIVPHLRNEGPVKIMSDSGMKVVWVGEASGEGQVASSEGLVASGLEEMTGEVVEGEVSSECGVASKGQPEMMREEISANEVAEVVAFGAEAAKKGTAGAGARSRRKSKRASEKTSGNRTMEVMESQAKSHELRAVSGRLPEMMQEEASEKRTTEVGERPAGSYDLPATSGRAPVMIREETSANGAVEISGSA